MKKIFFILTLALATFTFAAETHPCSIQSESTELSIDSIQTQTNYIFVENDSIFLVEKAVGKALENVEERPAAEKFYINGQIIIMKNGVGYTVNGMHVR